MSSDNSGSEATPTPSPSPSNMAESSTRQHLTVPVRRRAAGADADAGESNGGGRASRKRASDMGGPSASRRRTRAPSAERDDQGDLAEYDPDQSIQERRAIQRTLRDLQRQMRENPDEFLKSDPKALLNYLNQSDKIIRDVKQTAEAAIDSRGLVIAADLWARRVQRLTSDNVGNGIDVDEFVSKCITFMLQGRGIEDDAAEELSSTQRRRRQAPAAAAARGVLGSDDEDEVGDEGDMMNWSHLGRFAAVPSVRRPAVTGFMLGPLSIEKKARRMTKRSAPFKVSNLREVRPEELRVEDLKKSDKNDLPALCRKIHVRLDAAQTDAQDALDSDLPEKYTEEQLAALMNRYSLRRNGGIDLLRFVINPHSFGQTVENIFYISFLIREGSVKLEFDEDGFPEIEPVSREATPSATRSRHNTTRHQSIMSIDMKTWRDIIDAFDITEPMIPHREEEHQQGPGARGWYS